MPHSRNPPFRRRPRWTQCLWVSALLSAICLPFARAQEKTAADYFVHSLPGAPEPLLKMYAGHLEITPEHHGNMFFWLFKNKHMADRPRTVLWLNGGPGCSSMDGALMELGPYRINEDGTLRYNDGSWDEFANVLFVDNPVGTGFSYVDGDSLVHELDEMADQMITFLEKWFALFPEHMHDDLYIAGESYAGQHIPYIAEAIYDRNQGKPDYELWNLKGLLIGNGWISGPEQYTSFIPFLLEEGVLQSGSQAAQNARVQERECVKALEAGAKDHVDINTCEMIMLTLSRDLAEGGQCINVYDIRKTDTYPSCGMNWPPDLKQMTPYLRRDDVLEALHINPDKKTGWVECNGQVTRGFTTVNSRPSKELLPGLLEKLPIVLFSGDKDLICNHIGTENLIENLEWNGALGMESAPVKEWTFDDEPAGQWQTARNLTYLRFYNSSHMVPFDYPKRTRDMLDRFMGVDYSSIGAPYNSHIDGEEARPSLPDPNTGNGNGNGNGRPADHIDDVTDPKNTPPPTEEEQEKLEAATWAAYQRSGEAALIVVLIAAGLWGFFVYRDRRRRRKGYLGVFASDPYDDDGGAARLRNERGDIEAAAAFDESELDELSANGHYLGKTRGGQDRFGLADDEDEEEQEGVRSVPPTERERRVNGGVGFKKA